MPGGQHMSIKPVEFLMKFIGMYEDQEDDLPRDPREAREYNEEPAFSTARRNEERQGPVPVNRRGNIAPATIGTRRNFENTTKVTPVNNTPPAPVSMGNQSVRMVVFQPQTYEDTQTIIDNLKAKKPIIVNLENLNIDVAQRVLDFISGAIYALDGSVRKVSKGIFLLAPKGVDIAGNFASALPGSVHGKNYFHTPKRR